MNVVELTLGIALLLSIGMVFAKLCHLIRLPSVTGFILAGLAMGPSGFGIISMENVGNRLNHFTEIALMLIAFGIGEHIELRRMAGLGRDVVYISIAQVLGTFFLVAGGTYLTTWLVAGSAVNHQDARILSALKLAGWIGLVYFVARVIGKYYGAWLEAKCPAQRSWCVITWDWPWSLRPVWPSVWSS
jgi:Kef-type K+ transport system membrane component KefB